MKLNKIKSGEPSFDLDDIVFSCVENKLNDEVCLFIPARLLDESDLAEDIKMLVLYAQKHRRDHRTRH